MGTVHGYEYIPVRDFIFTGKWIRDGNRAGGLETCGYRVWKARERWFRSMVKIELSILSPGGSKLDRRMETRECTYVRDDRRQQCGYLYVIRIDYLMSAKSNGGSTPPWLSHAKSISVPRLVLRRSKFQQPQVPSIDRC